MENWWEKLHKAVDFLLPVALILLIVLLVIEFFFFHIAETFPLWIAAADGFIVAVFVLDVVFKYQRAVSIPNFLKESWLDIIAIFPFFLFFRLFETIGLVRAIGATAEIGEGAQQVLHAGVEVEKEISVVTKLEKEAKVAKEVEVIAKETARSERLLRFIKPILRTPRLAKAVEFYEEPQHKKEIKKDFREIEGNIKRIKRKIMH